MHIYKAIVCPVRFKIDSVLRYRTSGVCEVAPPDIYRLARSQSKSLPPVIVEGGIFYGYVVAVGLVAARNIQAITTRIAACYAVNRDIRCPQNCQTVAVLTAGV